MPIKIVRKSKCGVTNVVNSLFNAHFDKNIDEFTIPSLSWMMYLYKDFELVEATDENGDELDLKDIRFCCNDSIKLNVRKESRLIDSAKIDTDIERTFGNT